MPDAPPALYVVRQDRGASPCYVASSIGLPFDMEGPDGLAWTEAKGDALKLSRPTARRLASIVAVSDGRVAMVLPADEA